MVLTRTETTMFAARNDNTSMGPIATAWEEFPQQCKTENPDEVKKVFVVTVLVPYVKKWCYDPNRFFASQEETRTRVIETHDVAKFWLWAIQDDHVSERLKSSREFETSCHNLVQFILAFLDTGLDNNAAEIALVLMITRAKYELMAILECE